MDDLNEDYVLATLQRNGILNARDGWEARAADGGLNSRVLLIARPGTTPELIVRVSQPGRELILQREAGALNRVASTCSCAQQVIDLLDDGIQKMLVLSYAPGDLLGLAEASDAQIRSLTACLAAIHSHRHGHFTIWPETDEVIGTRAQAFVLRLNSVERYASFTGAAGEDVTRQIRFIHQRLMSATLAGEEWDERNFSLLHGDLSRGNIIWDGSDVTLIDWEYTRAGDPAEDLAYLLAEQQITAALHRLILARYVEQGGDAAAVTRVPTYTALVALDSALWWSDRYIDMNEDPGASPEVVYHLKRARQALD